MSVWRLVGLSLGTCAATLTLFFFSLVYFTIRVLLLAERLVSFAKCVSFGFGISSLLILLIRLIKVPKECIEGESVSEKNS